MLALWIALGVAGYMVVGGIAALAARRWAWFDPLNVRLGDERVSVGVTTFLLWPMCIVVAVVGLLVLAGFVCLSLLEEVERDD